MNLNQTSSAANLIGAKGAKLVGATLEYQLQAVNDIPTNDQLYLGFITGGQSGFSYGGNIGTAASGTSYIGSWNYGVRSNGFLNLGSLPNGTSIISSMQSYGTLDFAVQDDTAVDFLRLNVHYQGDYNTSNTDDVIKGFSGNDTLEGLTGNDILFGDEGNDLLDGGGLSGDPEIDILTGGTGKDTFVLGSRDNFGNSDLRYASQGTDDRAIITDFATTGTVRDNLQLLSLANLPDYQYYYGSINNHLAIGIGEIGSTFADSDIIAEFSNLTNSFASKFAVKSQTVFV